MKTKIWTNEIVDTPMKDRWVTDYHYLLSKWVSEKARKEFNTGDIWINAAVCLECREYIRSMNQHDFKTCTCWNLSVDWWSQYNRRCFKNWKDSYIDCIELFTNIKKWKI